MAINIDMDLMYTYQAHTLIDITNTNMLNNEQSKQRNQQRNWETIYQILSLRTQLMRFEFLGVVEDEVGKYSFGQNYSGKHKIWNFSFSVEHDDVYAIDNDRYGALKDDFKIAPVILGLDETAKPSIAFVLCQRLR
jgi:hypothetical protein